MLTKKTNIKLINGNKYDEHRLDYSDYYTTLIYAPPGFGKTTLLAYIVNQITKITKFKIYIITESPEIYTMLNNPPSRKKMVDYFDFKEINKFRTSKGLKIIILDDIIGLDLRRYAVEVGEILSRSRKYNCYVFMSTQALQFIGKHWRMMARNIIVFRIDKDTIDFLSSISGVEKNELRRTRLKKHEFLFYQPYMKKPEKGKL